MRRSGAERRAGQRSVPFERALVRRRGEKGEAGVRGWARCRVGVGEGAEGGGAGVQCRVGQHGTGAVALGRAGAAGALRTGEATRGVADDKWGRVTSGPVASGGVRKGEERTR
jgi:hypothetical protein